MKNPYNEVFYTEMNAWSRASALVIVPLVQRVIQAESVIDVGCGTGIWLAEFSRNGVRDILGLDGAYVDPERLVIPQQQFFSMDLGKSIKISRKFDLAVCLEVAEHLPAKRAKSFICELSQLSGVVLFSAAAPGQGGTGHLNEQLLSFWIALFKSFGFKVFDCIRPAIWSDSTVAYWYRQNVVLFVREDHALYRYASGYAEDCLLGPTCRAAVNPSRLLKNPPRRPTKSLQTGRDR